MTPSALSSSSAVHLLGQINRSSVGRETLRAAPGAQLVAIANGAAAPAVSAAGAPSQWAKAQIPNFDFGAAAPSVTEMKMHLMKRVGDEFASRSKITKPIRRSVRLFGRQIAEIKMQPNGALVLAAIEKKLGFDKLGFSLDAFVNAITEPKGSDGQKVDAALRKHLGLDDGEDDKLDGVRSVLAALQVDESGLYGFRTS